MVMRALIYKRTHCGDPDPEGRFGIHVCMGKVRTRGFDAVIGVGGIGAEPRRHKLDRKLNWIGLGAHESGEFNEKDGWPIITFDHFLLFSPEGGEPPEEFKKKAPLLAKRLLDSGKRNARVLMVDLGSDEKLDEQREVERILALAKDPGRFSADGARPMTTSGGCGHRLPSAKSIKGCSSRPAPRPAARTRC